MDLNLDPTIVVSAIDTFRVLAFRLSLVLGVAYTATLGTVVYLAFRIQPIRS